MEDIKAVDGSALAPESIRMMEYLQTRSEKMNGVAIRERIRAAAAELEKAVDAVAENNARKRPVEGKWNIAEVVDHISQTQIRAAEELRHLLAGRRPPLPPVYEAIRSGAAQWAPWDMLVSELRAANQAMIDVLADVNDDPITPASPTARTVMVALTTKDDGRTEPQIFFVELNWKEYALIQRLHLLDHRTQVKKLNEAIAPTQRTAYDSPA